MSFKTIAELSKGLHAREFSSSELAASYLDRCKELNPQLNCYISLLEEQAMAQAKTADRHLQSGNASLLTGIPLAHKDIFCTNGVKTSCGSKMLDNFVAPYDATVVKRLNQAGAVILGKTNMDEFAMGSSNETSYYGAVKNPWNTECVPGGSSGGSAVAVAAGLATASTGTDTGGSIRQPAAFCGITGLKPTYGRVSRYGMIAFASSLDQGGAMAHTAEDAAILLNAMAGFDDKDSTSADQPTEDYTANLNDGLQGLTIGLPKQYFDAKLDSKIAALIDTGVKQLQSLGAQVKQIELENLQLSIPVYYVIASAECSSNLSRFDGVRFGYRCKNAQDINDLYCRSRAEGFGKEVKRRIIMGTYILSEGYYDTYYLKAQQVRRLIRDDFSKALQEVDVIISPTAPSVAFRLNELLDDPVNMYLSDIYTVAINLAGLPAISVPVGYSGGLPVGMQIIANYFAESRLLNIAHRFQQVTDWHQKSPPEFS